MLETLIAFPTVSSESNLGLIEWARDHLARLGAKSRLTYDAAGGKANLFATLGEGRKAGLVLSGHTDVVPVDGQDWDTDPFKATIKDGKLYGRGASDMKGYLAVILAQAPRFLEAMNTGLYDAPMHFALSYDEEIGCIGVRGLIADLAQHHIRPAGCIVGEPTSMHPVIAHKGKRDFCCRVSGREAHSAMTPLGVNAIEYAARLIVHIRQIADRMAQLEARQYAYPVPSRRYRPTASRVASRTTSCRANANSCSSSATCPAPTPTRSKARSVPTRRNSRRRCVTARSERTIKASAWNAA